MKEDIVFAAIENLKRVVPLNAVWKSSSGKETDGKLELQMAGKKVILHAIVIEELGEDQLNQIYKLAYKYTAFIVIARKISPRTRMILRQIRQAYLEGDGDIFLFQKNVCLLLETTQNNNNQKLYEKKNTA